MSVSWWILTAFGAAALAFVFRELLIGVTGWLARQIITRAARRLPEGRRELRHEEWLAEHDLFVTKGLHVAGVIHACGTYVGAVRIAPSRQIASKLKRISSTSSSSVARVRPGIIPAIVTMIVVVAFASVGILFGNTAVLMASLGVSVSAWFARSIVHHRAYLLRRRKNTQP